MCWNGRFCTSRIPKIDLIMKFLWKKCDSKILYFSHCGLIFRANCRFDLLILVRMRWWHKPILFCQSRGRQFDYLFLWLSSEKKLWNNAPKYIWGGLQGPFSLTEDHRPLTEQDSASKYVWEVKTDLLPKVGAEKSTWRPLRSYQFSLKEDDRALTRQDAA